MIQMFFLAQSVSIEKAIADSGPVALIVSLIGGAAIGGAIIGLLLKYVAAAVLNYPVRYLSAFLVVFIAFLISGAVEMALIQGGVIPPMEFNPDGPILEQLMRIGLVGFTASEAAAFFALVWSTRSFLLGPDDARPRLGKAALIALIVTLVQVGFAFAALRLSAGLQ